MTLFNFQNIGAKVYFFYRTEQNASCSSAIKQQFWVPKKPFREQFLKENHLSLG